MAQQKKVFLTIILALALVLATAPFLVSFNDLLTKVVEKNRLYGWIQSDIVPVEARMMGGLLLPLGYQYSYSRTNGLIIVNGMTLSITWNCLGWQSFILMLVSMLVGFRGRYRKLSVLVAVGIGVLGTFWLNILRMLFTVLLAVHAPAIFRVVFHDYLAAISTVAWLLAFWWFSYRYVLEEKADSD